jgi:hypothetical protein
LNKIVQITAGTRKCAATKTVTAQAALFSKFLRHSIRDAYFRVIWHFQVNCPKLGDLFWLVIPYALTELGHWSPDIKV